MLKKIIALISALLCAGLFMINAAAFDSANLLEYYSAGDTMTLYVNGITGSDISCRIAGQECTAELSGGIYSDSDKYKTLFLIDSSTSMRHYSDKISDILLDCIDKKPQNEYFSIAVFAGRSYSNITDFVSDRYDLEKAVASIKYEAQSTYIYDNVNNAIKTLVNDEDKCYERIVLFTDGCENSATGISIDELLNTINSTPVQIYTVTFVNSAKNNYEQLKSAARIARSSNAADIQVTENTDIKELANTLHNDVISISSIVISELGSSIADGSRRPIEIVSGEIIIKAEVTTPMVSVAAENMESVPDETTVSALETVSQIADSGTKKDSEVNMKLIFIIAAIVAVVAIIVIIITAVTANKNKTVTNDDTPEPIQKADNDDTVLIRSNGETEMLFDDNRSASVIILRDIASTEHTFEAPLSDDVVIGRSSELSSVVIDYDKSVSKRHCKIFTMGDEIFIEDLGSANRTYVNDTEISSAHVLRNADEVKIGRVKFKVTIR